MEKDGLEGVTAEKIVLNRVEILFQPVSKKPVSKNLFSKNIVAHGWHPNCCLIYKVPVSIHLLQSICFNPSASIQM
jgi:hypothetical protein